MKDKKVSYLRDCVSEKGIYSSMFIFMLQFKMFTILTSTVNWMVRIEAGNSSDLLKDFT